MFGYQLHKDRVQKVESELNSRYSELQFSAEFRNHVLTGADDFGISPQQRSMAAQSAPRRARTVPDSTIRKREDALMEMKHALRMGGPIEDVMARFPMAELVPDRSSVAARPTCGTAYPGASLFTPLTHSFRDRIREKELFRGHFAVGRPELPRVALRGGGVIDPEQTERVRRLRAAMPQSISRDNMGPTVRTQGPFSASAGGNAAQLPRSQGVTTLKTGPRCLELDPTRPWTSWLMPVTTADGDRPTVWKKIQQQERTNRVRRTLYDQRRKGIAPAAPEEGGAAPARTGAARSASRQPLYFLRPEVEPSDILPGVPQDELHMGPHAVATRTKRLQDESTARKRQHDRDTAPGRQFFVHTSRNGVSARTVNDFMTPQERYRRELPVLHRTARRNAILRIKASSAAARVKRRERMREWNRRDRGACETEWEALHGLLAGGSQTSSGCQLERPAMCRVPRRSCGSLSVDSGAS